MTLLVPALDRAIRMLYLFKNGDQQDYGVSEISRLLALNKSTVHNILNTLVFHDFLIQTETRRYQLGPALAELGSLVRSQLDIRAVARPYMRRLMEQSSATILLGVLNDTVITIVDKDEPLAGVRVAASIGMRMPFCAGAFGQAFLAYLPAETVDQLLIKQGLKSFTPTSIIDVDHYRATLAQVRQQGYALDDQEAYLLDVGAIAAPIFIPGPHLPEHEPPHNSYDVAGVITLVNFSSRLTAEKIAEFTPYLLEASREISARLGTSKTIDNG